MNKTFDGDRTCADTQDTVLRLRVSSATVARLKAVAGRRGVSNLVRRFVEQGLDRVVSSDVEFGE